MMPSLIHAVILRHCLNHINDKIKLHKKEMKQKIFRLIKKYEEVPNLIQAVAGIQ